MAQYSYMLPSELFDLLLHGVFFILLLFVTVYGVILGYHWFAYSASKSMAVTTMSIFVLGCFFCFFLMLPSLF